MQEEKKKFIMNSIGWPLTPWSCFSNFLKSKVYYEEKKSFKILFNNYLCPPPPYLWIPYFLEEDMVRLTQCLFQIIQIVMLFIKSAHWANSMSVCCRLFVPSSCTRF